MRRPSECGEPARTSPPLRRRHAAAPQERWRGGKFAEEVRHARKGLAARGSQNTECSRWRVHFAFIRQGSQGRLELLFTFVDARHLLVGCPPVVAGKRVDVAAIPMPSHPLDGVRLCLCQAPWDDAETFVHLHLVYCFPKNYDYFEHLWLKEKT